MLSVLIATYNGATTLPRVLDAYCLLLAPPGGWELIIVDNASTDTTPCILQHYAARLPLIRLYQARRGKNAALNCALPHAQGQLLVFSDDDATPEPDWLVQLARCAKTQPGYAIFGGRILPDWEIAPAEWVTRLAPLGQTYAVSPPHLTDGPVFPGLIWGANMALRRSVIDAGHQFEEAIGPNGASYAMGSETELTIRLARAGFHAWFCAGARVAHRIRAHQVQTRYILARAGRFGRGMYRQQRADHEAVPMLLHVPRWMLRRFADEAAKACAAALRRDHDRLFLARWELHYLLGFFREAWQRERVAMP